MLARRHRLLASGPTFSCTVNDADTKYVDMGALGELVTRTANVTIRPMVPMVILALRASPGRRKGERDYLVIYIEEQQDMV